MSDSTPNVDQYNDPYERGYWASQAGKLSGENIVLKRRIAELEARLKQAQDWRVYYRDRWMGETMDGVTPPITDEQLETALNQQEKSS